MKTFRKLRFAGVVSPSDNVRTAAHQILRHEYAIAASCIKTLSKTHRKRSMAVHDLRVSARRFRSAVRLFNGLLHPTDIRACTDALKAISDQLSTIRDREVWLAFLESVTLPDTARECSEFVALHGAAQAAYRQSREELPLCLSRDVLQSLLELAPKVIEKQIPALRGPESKRLASRFVSRRLGVSLAVLEGPMPEIGHMSSDALHTMRKSVRQLRYWGEFAEPILEGPVVALTARLKDAADGLGTAHDIDVHMAQVDPDTSGLSGLYGAMNDQRAQGLALFQKQWCLLCRKSSRRRLDVFLREWAG